MSERGRPPKFKDVSEMKGLIDDYFADCEGKPLLDGDGQPVFDKRGNPILMGAHPPTVTGLALALGFTSRQALLNYQAKAKFVDTITRAKSICEEYAERRLFDQQGCNGAKFSLINNFKGWTEKQVVEADMKNQVTINIDLVDDEEEDGGK